MGFFDLFKVNVHPQSSLEAYERLADNKICKFYLHKIPKYCSFDEILWIEAGVIENNKVMSFRINYFDAEHGENLDTKVSFRRYGHKGMPMKEFSDFMRYLSVAMHKSKFIFLERSFDDCQAGCIYDRKYARKMFLI